MKFSDTIPLAIRTLQGNKLRSILTLSIIAIGITALIGILTSIDVLKNSLSQNFVSLGSNTFTIQQSDGLQRGRARNKNPIISFKEAEKFKEKYAFPAEISMYTQITSNATIKTSFKESNPNVLLTAVDENYMKVAGKNLILGRSFSSLEIENGRNVTVIGYDLARSNFESIDSIIGSLISIEAKKYKVIGITEAKGSSAGKNDNFALIPYVNAKREFDISNESFSILISVLELDKLDWAIDEALGVFRPIRQLSALEEDNFFIAKSDKLANTLISQISYISIATIIIGILTLIGAGVGLMNIMLVSVNERTREIGIAKSLGATKRVIFNQFLAEAVMLCLAGALVGIVLGVMLGNVLSFFLKSGFVFPFFWVFIGLVFSTFIGIGAGLFPAIKASKLNPVEALRYE
ncbi:MAG: ABC transporter permease [Chitinophagales bacterium]